MRELNICINTEQGEAADFGFRISDFGSAFRIPHSAIGATPPNYIWNNSMVGFKGSLVDEGV